MIYKKKEKYNFNIIIIRICNLFVTCNNESLLSACLFAVHPIHTEAVCVVLFFKIYFVNYKICF